MKHQGGGGKGDNVFNLAVALGSALQRAVTVRKYVHLLAPWVTKKCSPAACSWFAPIFVSW